VFDDLEVWDQNEPLYFFKHVEQKWIKKCMDILKGLEEITEEQYQFYGSLCFSEDVNYRDVAKAIVKSFEVKYNTERDGDPGQDRKGPSQTFFKRI